MSVQIIKKGDEPEWAVIPFEVYQQLVRDAEMLQDIQDYDEAKIALEKGEELVPSEVVYAILEGQNAIRVWREYRGLTQQGLAEAVGISVPYLSQIESGKRKGSTRVLASIARELGLALDDIVQG